MTAPYQIIDLIERFEQNRDAYISLEYNETQLRQEFVNPFFEALGWDIYNKQGYAEPYKDVIHEYSLKIGDTSKAPDYCFRIGGARKFFVETKKPAINIKEDATAAFQLRRYAWSAKLPLSILTDFEELAVYDTRVKPASTDKASAARILYLKYTDYAERWSEIESVFSRDAILKGAFDKYVNGAKSKKGTTEVDDAFLEEIEGWRNDLARNVALRNTELTQRELNFAVQVTIDRIIFLRICEDRGTEIYGGLMALQNGTNVYKRLMELFTQADEKYNSGLFHFSVQRDRPVDPDRLTPKLVIDDKTFKDIIKRLYYPNSPYEFSVLPADILGQVYEQFLGKVIRLTAGHHAVVEDKPEVKKAGGVYYTPTYIVDYIVKNTVGKFLKDKKTGPRGGASKLKILDPACGSGSFLIGAFQYILDWHRDKYFEDGPEKHTKELYQSAGGEWRLTTAERKRILLNNIYGVDIDSQAVEVTKLSLLLKVLEGENEETLSTQLRMFRERALPDLANNIKCGNSLIGPDFYHNRQMNLLDEEERYRVNAFDWNAEFPDIMKEGGFDAVIGNPPYGYMISNPDKSYFQNKYKHQDYQLDFYLLFLERYEYLLKHEGLLGVIVSNTWLQSLRLMKIRQHLTANYNWLRIMHLPEKVFKSIVDTHVLIFQNIKEKGARNETISIDARQNGEVYFMNELPWGDIGKDGEPINIVASPTHHNLFKKIKNISLPLAHFCEVYNGVKPFSIGRGDPPQTEAIMKDKPYVAEGRKPDKTWSPLLRGSLINRYVNLWKKNYWIKYGPCIAEPRDPKIFNAPVKIMVRQTGDSIIATIVGKGFIARNNMHIILPKIDSKYDLRYFLGIINSRFMDFCYTMMNPEKGEALAEVKKKHVEILRIYPIDFDIDKDKSRHDHMVELVTLMLELHKRLDAAQTEHERTALSRQIEATDKQIDQLVYELYDLTDEEIKIVEEAVR